MFIFLHLADDGLERKSILTYC